MVEQLINDEFVEIFKTEDEVMTENAASEFEGLMLKMLSPYYREYLVSANRKLIIECVRNNKNTHLIDEYIGYAADAMSNSDDEIVKKLKENMALKRDEVEGEYLNEIFDAITLHP